MSTRDYLPFAPLHLLSQLGNQASTTPISGDLLKPFSKPVYGTVLFADISGFTSLSTKLTSEQLKNHIK